MSTFMFQGSYTAASVAAMIKKPEDRTAVVAGMAEALGGKLEGFWLSFGNHDFVGIVQLPDAESATAFSMAVAAGGGVHNYKTIPLLSWADGLKALKKAGSVKYSPPVKPAK